MDSLGDHSSQCCADVATHGPDAAEYAGLGQPDQMLQLQVVVQFRRFLGGQSAPTFRGQSSRRLAVLWHPTPRKPPRWSDWFRRQ